MEKKCTLSNEELIAICEKWAFKLSESGGKAWMLSVPVNFKDPDVLLIELAERLKAAAPQGIGWVKGAPQLKRQHFAKVRSMIEDNVIYDAVIWPIEGSEYWWCTGKGFKFDAPPGVIIAYLDEGYPQPGKG